MDIDDDVNDDTNATTTSVALFGPEEMKEPNPPSFFERLFDEDD